ncbi:hypothetical protein Sango_2649800 [Sesamum angolense]|uniref:Uncharacterized protein n=1 Tax=Sesamum angolense TaxID=2727404 RepID=A0AAE1W212_9LAMI|nr:hypothetical protein Sango_2649800 [Sesamum angolense]
MAKTGSENDKFNFSRLLSREKYSSSKQGEASFRVLYYGGAAGSVPFLWESQPGTPKHTFNDDPLPPLTPPPSYQSSPRPSPLQKKNSKNSRFFNSIFARAPSRKIKASRSFSPPPSSSSSSSFSSSSCSLPSTPVNARRGSIKARSRSTTAVYFGLDEDEIMTSRVKGLLLQYCALVLRKKEGLGVILTQSRVLRRSCRPLLVGRARTINVRESVWCWFCTS